MAVHYNHASLATYRLDLLTPPDFNFWRTAYSHGWCDLPPFNHNVEERTLDRILRLSDELIIACRLRGSSRHVHLRISSPRHLTEQSRREIRTQIRSCLRLDEDISAFHTAARRYHHFRWVARAGAGRLLRAPTVFEDIVKMICTTNCSWALTKTMVINISREFGDPCAAGGWAFPLPDQLAGSTEQVLRQRCKTGYRAPFLLGFAELVASGKLPVETWRRSSLSTPELYKSVCSVKGVGPYAAGNIVRLLGRYDYLALDSWVRKKFAELHTRGRKVKDSTIERAFARYGEWRGLFFWLEMTHEWHHEKFVA